ncbi:MAG TPA: 16S rRNA (cytidine(1402)-2'-O)-methyltransferase [Candidatus Dojkabacteria bacterium]|nr:16S rRNA (cytidine(1402)-2'-O)-methyltransferase [Candidatus Dojkabacteria bacterium]
MKNGKLYVVATPIGNLEDITYRAVSTLKNVPFILAEDTRESKKLLDRYEIGTPLISYRDQNHQQIITKIIDKLKMGLDLALISDAGTPLISDPGYKLVKQLRDLGYEVISIPGASAVTSALSISGLPTDKFVFFGFLPKSDVRRQKIIEQYSDKGITIVVYESPNRLVKLLNLVGNILGYDCRCFLARDISKLREENIYGSIKDVLNILEEREFEKSPHGEFVCVFNNRVSKEKEENS